MIDNLDETHFVVNLDNWKTLGFCGQENKNSMDVVSGGQGMTMIVRFIGGKAASIALPMLIFQIRIVYTPSTGLLMIYQVFVIVQDRKAGMTE